MKQINTIKFIDQASHQNGFAVVRAGGGQVAVGLSLEQDGDVEAIFKPAVCEQLIAALQEAMRFVSESGAE